MIAGKASDAINQAVCYELQNIVKNYGATYNSRHEAYAVLQEEIEEAFEAYKEMNILGELWQLIRDDTSKENMIEKVEEIKSWADDLACEAVQCAAVCERFIETLKREDAEK